MHSDHRRQVRRYATDTFTFASVHTDYLSIEVSLETYTGRNQWLILLFIPAAFSYVCPTEVVAFNNVVSEFTENSAALAFVSTDSKHSLLQWTERPRHEGGLGQTDVPLFSDQNHQMSRAYGVLLEDEGCSLRGMFIINPHGIIKHVRPSSFPFPSFTHTHKLTLPPRSPSTI